MLVFRCECEQVLGVDDDSSKGRMGECPSCGRIIRVPQGLIDAAGKLRFAGTPARAASSGPLRELSESAALLAKTAEAAAQNGHASTNGHTGGAAQPAAPAVPVSEIEPASDSAEPETLSPLSGDEQSADAVSEPEAEAPADAAPVAAAATKFKSGKKPIQGPKRSSRYTGSPKASAKSDAVESPEADDPNAAVETRNDKNLGSLASAAAARRKRIETPAAAPSKSKTLIYIIFAVILIAGLSTLYMLGYLNFGAGAPAKSGSSAVTVPSTSTESTGTATVPTTTAEPKPDVKTIPDAATPPVDKPPETPPTPTAEKKTDADKKDAAPDAK